jgi:hypothetical protein
MTPPLETPLSIFHATGKAKADGPISGVSQGAFQTVFHEFAAGFP